MENAVAVRYPDLDRRLTYEPQHMRQHGVCRLRVWHPEEVAVVTELDDNPGMSITNAIESVADAIAAVLGVDVGSDRGYLLVEHYEAGKWRQPTFDVVRFCRVVDGHHVQPSWAPVRDALKGLQLALCHPSMRS